MDDLVEFLRARLDDDERTVRDRLCINCGNRVVPLQSYVGVTGYTHEGGWQGRRCQGRLVGATPVQGPARVLADIEAKRLLLDDHPIVPETYPRPTVAGKEVGGPYFPFGCENCHAEDETGEVHGFGYCFVWKALALPYAEHPEYREEWRP